MRVLSDIPNLLNQLILGQRRLESLDLIALLSQDVLASDVDVLEQQNLDILGVEGLELLGRGNGAVDGAEAGRRGVKGSGRASRRVEAVGDGSRGAGAIADGDVLCSRHVVVLCSVVKERQERRGSEHAEYLWSITQSTLSQGTQ